MAILADGYKFLTQHILDTIITIHVTGSSNNVIHVGSEVERAVSF